MYQHIWNFIIILQNMSKLIPPKYSNPLADWSVQHIIKQIGNQIFLKNSTELSSTVLANDITTANRQSIKQISYCVPLHAPVIAEDKKPTKIKGLPDRPFSAKVQKVSVTRQQKQKRPSENVDPKLVRSSFSRQNMSAKSIGSRRKLSVRNQSKKQGLVPLTQFHEPQASNERVVEKMRYQKLKTEMYQTRKQNFMKNINKENELYFKDQYKFINAFNKKDHTYNYLGDIVQVSKKQSSLKIKKRLNHNAHTVKIIEKNKVPEPRQNSPIDIKCSNKELESDLVGYVFEDQEKEEKVLKKIHENEGKKNIKFTIVRQD